MRRALVLLALCACGDDHGAPMDAAGDGATGCTARFTGNFTETSLAPSNCPTPSPALELQLASATVGSPIAVSIAAPGAIGHYSSEVIGDWHVLGVRRIGDGGCEYNAGATAIPAGSFTLDVTAVDGATV